MNRTIIGETISLTFGDVIGIGPVPDSFNYVLNFKDDLRGTEYVFVLGPGDDYVTISTDGDTIKIEIDWQLILDYYDISAIAVIKPGRYTVRVVNPFGPSGNNTMDTVKYEFMDDYSHNNVVYHYTQYYGK